MVTGPEIVEMLAFYRGYEAELRTLAIYTVAIAAYALVVYGFYQYISRRNILGTHDSPKAPGLGAAFVRLLRYIFLFPLFSFGYFLVLSAALFFLAKSQDVPQLLLISMTVVAGVRASAYISENAAVDLAKTIPLGLLAVLLIDPGYASLDVTLARFNEVTGQLDLVLRYFIAVVLLEFGLKLFYTIAKHINPMREPQVDDSSLGADVESDP
ncbi:MAG: hypothetical protein HY556_07140 [Euryarchaeota archaeon]|nr:hypothetical protein [Euryarchaeota archaeon]